MKDAYDYPKYYEIALSPLRKLKKEVDFFEQAIQKFSKVKVKTMLEIGCGNSPHLPEIAKRGYKFIGLDLNQKMLNYTKEKAKAVGAKIQTVKADMMNFRLKNKADFAFVLFGSIYRKSNKDFLRHLKCVSNSMKKGGLYVLHQVIETWPAHLEEKGTSIIKRGNIIIKATYERKAIGKDKQLFDENLILHVNDRGKKLDLLAHTVAKYILPKEFLELVKQSDFEFLAWYNGFNINKPLKKISGYPVCIIRKK